MATKPKWIWPEGDRDAIDVRAWFRRTFDLPAKPLRATLHITASYRYLVFVNGHRLGPGPNFADPQYQYVDEWDITPFLIAGSNCLAVMAHNLAVGTHYSLAQPGGLWAELELDVRHNMQATIVTDSSWKTLSRGPYLWPVPRQFWTVDFQEQVVCCEAPSGWTQAGFDDSTWTPAQELGASPLAPWMKLIPREIPPLAITPLAPARLVASGLSTPVENAWLLSASQPSGEVGFELELEAKAPVSATLWLSADDEFELEFDGQRLARQGFDEAFVQTMTTYHRKLVKDEYHLGAWFPIRSVPLNLNAGLHRLVLKLKACPDTWGAQLHLPVGLEVTSRAVWPAEAGTLEPLLPGPGLVHDVALRLMREPLQLSLKPTQVEMPLLLTRERNVVVLDMERLAVGTLRLAGVSRSRGSLDIAYGEALAPDGRVDCIRNDMSVADSLHFASGRRKRFEWDFTGRRAFRYLQLEATGGLEVALDEITLFDTRYPVEPLGSFRSQDERLSRIWQVGADTVSACMGDNWEDCPTREHAQYPGDAYVEFPIALYAFGDFELSAKGLRQFGRSLSKEGFVNGRWPSSHILPWLLNYELFWISWLADHTRWSGDMALVEKLFPAVLTVLAYHRGFYDNDGLLRVPGKLIWEQFTDHLDVDSRGEVTGHQCNFYKGLVDAAFLAELAGHPEEARLLKDEALAVQEAAWQLLYVPEKGLYTDCRLEGEPSEVFTRQSNCWAIWSGLAPEEAWQGLWEAMQQASLPTIKNPWSQFFVLEAMAKLGLYQEALPLIEEYYGGMLDRGAITWWELFDPAWPEDTKPGSLCHGWSGAPTYFLSRHIAGVDWRMVPEPELLVTPHPEGWPPFHAEVPTPLGLVRVEWDGKKVEIKAPRLL